MKQSDVERSGGPIKLVSAGLLHLSRKKALPNDDRFVSKKINKGEDVCSKEFTMNSSFELHVGRDALSSIIVC